LQKRRAIHYISNTVGISSLQEGNATYSIEVPTIIQITPEPAFASSIDATYDVFVTTSTGVKQFTFLLVGGTQNINISQFCDPS
jgi:hypothetical protein